MHLDSNSGSQRRSFLGSAALLTVAFVATVSLGWVAIHPTEFGWDFTTFHAAGRASAAGENPYDRETLATYGQHVEVPFIYPPATIWLFRPFASVDRDTGFRLWWCLKLFTLVWLLALWRKYLGEAADWRFYVFLFVAFGNPIFMDFAAGNTALLETALLWFGFVALREQRTGTFAVPVALASQFRWTPMLFLPLDLVTHAPRRRLWLVWGTLASLAVAATGAAGGPEQFGRFVKSALAWDERGPELNPSLLALCRDALELLSGSSASANSQLALGAYVLGALAALWMFLRRVAQARSSGSMDTGWLIDGACMTYLLVAPRLKPYTMVLILPVAFKAISRLGHGWRFGLAVLFLSLAPYQALPPLRTLNHSFWYYPLVVVLLLWLLWLRSPGISTRSE